MAHNNDGLPEWAKITSDLAGDNDDFETEPADGPADNTPASTPSPPPAVSPNPVPQNPVPQPSATPAPAPAPAVPSTPPAPPVPVNPVNPGGQGSPRRPGAQPVPAPPAAPTPPSPPAASVSPTTPAPASPAPPPAATPAPPPAPVVSAPVPAPSPANSVDSGRYHDSYAGVERLDPTGTPSGGIGLPDPASGSTLDPGFPHHDSAASEEAPVRRRGLGLRGNKGADANVDRREGDSGQGGETSSRGSRFSGRGKKPSSGRFAGGRGVLFVLRGLVWVVVGLLILLGVRQMFFPAQTNTQAITDQVAAALGASGFPVEAGQALAEQFTITYLTQEVNNEMERRDELLALLPNESVVGDLGIRGVERQRIVAGPFLSRPVQSTPTRTTYTFAAQIAATPLEGEEQEPRWVYLAVPVAANETGIAIAGAPAFVPAVEIATQGEPLPFTNDSQAADSLAPDLEGFFEAWAASDQAELARYTADDASPESREGLNGEFVFEGLDKVQVNAVDPENPQPVRDALAAVLWRYGPSQVRQEYRLQVFEAEDGRWYVSDIRGATYTVP